jgi:hypothetical protein
LLKAKKIRPGPRINGFFDPTLGFRRSVQTIPDMITQLLQHGAFSYHHIVGSRLIYVKS